MYKILMISALSFFLMAACTKKEGEGGSASLRGSVQVKVCGADTTKPYATFMAQEEDVYIVYGAEDTYGDSKKTHYDGVYQFDYLRKGDYTLYAYSDNFNAQGSSEKVKVAKAVHIGKNGEKKELPMITIYKSVDNYEGTSVIKGRLFAYDWNAELTEIKDSFYVKNKYVYIARQMDHYYFERQRTYYDGSFVFPFLPVGKYEVYAYGRDISAQDPQDLVPTIKVVEITENAQVKDIGRLEIIE